MEQNEQTEPTEQAIPDEQTEQAIPDEQTEQAPVVVATERSIDTDRLNMHIALFPDVQEAWIRIFRGGSLIAYEADGNKPEELRFAEQAFKVFALNMLAGVANLILKQSAHIRTDQTAPISGGVPIHLLIRFRPSSGQYWLTAYKGGYIGDISYQGQMGKDDSSLMVSDRSEVLSLALRIIGSVTVGLEKGDQARVTPARYMPGIPQPWKVKS